MNDAKFIPAESPPAVPPGAGAYALNASPVSGGATDTGCDGRMAPPKPSRLWLWFVAAFALQLGAWITWFAIAGQHKVVEVPLATRTGS